MSEYKKIVSFNLQRDFLGFFPNTQMVLFYLFHNVFQYSQASTDTESCWSSLDSFHHFDTGNSGIHLYLHDLKKENMLTNNAKTYFQFK